MIPSKYSVKVVLGLVMVAAGLMLLAVLMPPLYSAITLREAVARTDALVSISNALLHALQTQRRERTTLGTALQADWIIKPDVEAEAKAYRDVTEPSYQQAIAAIPPLDLSGIKPMFDRLIQAHTVLNALRPQVDEAVHRPLAERPAGLAKAWADACLAQLNTLDAVADVVDAAVQLTDAQVDQFLAVKRAAWVARNFFGVELLTGVDGLAAHKPWTAAQIDAAAQARGRATDAWTIVAAVAARSDVPFALKNAFIKTTEDYFGANAKVRQPVTDALLQGRVPDLSGNDYLKLTLPSLANFNDVSTAAVDAMIGRSSQLNRGAWEQIVLCAFELVFSTLLIVSGFMIVLFRVSRPLQSLTDAMGHLARGEYATAVPGLGRGDEIGAMANAVQTFKENGLAMRRMETEAMEQRQLAENERAKTDAQREQAAARLAQVVEGLADGLAQLAAGNLTVSLDATFAPEYDRLRIDFNAAVCGLQAALRDVLLHTEAIGTGTVEIANAADDLARRTEQQAAGLEQTAAALDEVTATVRQTAENSGRAQNVAVVTKAEADRSGKVVDEAVAAMSTIEGSARQIGQIIGVIDEIAFQTSLLALNAGVEAARAGEAGRGFAVVAQEVRALAQRAADAAKQIKTLVTNSMLQVERGVRLVGETGNALGRIQAGVVEMDQVIREIAASATEQAQGLAEVNIAVNQMDQTTQQNAAMVEQSTSATHSLAQETNALQKAMSRFRIEPQTNPVRSQNLAS